MIPILSGEEGGWLVHAPPHSHTHTGAGASGAERGGGAAAAAPGGVYNYLFLVLSGGAWMEGGVPCPQELFTIISFKPSLGRGHPWAGGERVGECLDLRGEGGPPPGDPPTHLVN